MLMEGRYFCSAKIARVEVGDVEDCDKYKSGECLHSYSPDGLCSVLENAKKGIGKLPVYSKPPPPKCSLWS